MEKQKPTLTVIGAIIGAVLLYLIIQAAIGHLEDGIAHIEAEEAAAKTVVEGGEAAPVAEGAPITETTVLTVTSPTTKTEAIVETTSVTKTETLTSTTPAAETSPPTAEAVAPAASDEVVAIVNKGTCNACHVIPGVPGAVGIVGPDLSNIGTAAAERKPGVSAKEYLLESIMDPNAFIAPECPFGACVPGAMPATLATTLTAEEIDAIIEYLLTLHGGG